MRRSLLIPAGILAAILVFPVAAGAARAVVGPGIVPGGTLAHVFSHDAPPPPPNGHDAPPPRRGEGPPPPPRRGEAPPPPTGARCQAVEVEGRVDRFQSNRHGEVDGFVLTDRTDVRFPPHEGGRVEDVVDEGSRVSVRGCDEAGPDGRDPHVRATEIRNEDTDRSVTIDDRPAPPPGRHVRPRP